MTIGIGNRANCKRAFASDHAATHSVTLNSCVWNWATVHVDYSPTVTGRTSDQRE